MLAANMRIARNVLDVNMKGRTLRGARKVTVEVMATILK